MADFSFIANAHPDYIESMYQKFRQDPDALDPTWMAFFKGFEYGEPSNGTHTPSASVQFTDKEFQVLSLIKAFRNRGHLLSTTNPIRQRRNRKPNLNLEDFGLSDSDLDTVFLAGTETGIKQAASLRSIIDHLSGVYCRNIGFEYHHIQDREKRRWLRNKIESLMLGDDYGLDLKKKRRILEKLNGAVGFERFLHTKYIGQKRFSLEGGENAIVALDGIINKAADDGVEEVVMGMAHRGRLNVLANIMGENL